jgi:hypothetical protein
VPLPECDSTDFGVQKLPSVSLNNGRQGASRYCGNSISGNARGARSTLMKGSMEDQMFVFAVATNDTSNSGGKSLKRLSDLRL